MLRIYCGAPCQRCYFCFTYTLHPHNLAVKGFPPLNGGMLTSSKGCVLHFTLSWTCSSAGSMCGILFQGGRVTGYYHQHLYCTRFIGSNWCTNSELANIKHPRKWAGPWRHISWACKCIELGHLAAQVEQATDLGLPSLFVYLRRAKECGLLLVCQFQPTICPARLEIDRHAWPFFRNTYHISAAPTAKLR